MKKVVLILIIFLVSVGIYSQLNNSKQLSSSAPEQTATIFPSKKPKLQNKWLTYENKKFDYKINWHIDWHKQDENEPPYPPPPVGINFGRRFDNGDSCDFGIMSSTSKDNFQGEIENLQRDKKYKVASSKIDQVETLEFFYQSDKQLVKSYYFTDNNNAYRMGFNINAQGSNSQLCLNVFKKMVNSFEFIL